MRTSFHENTGHHLFYHFIWRSFDGLLSWLYTMLAKPSMLCPCWLAHMQAHLFLDSHLDMIFFLSYSHSNKIKLAWWNPTFVLFDGGTKLDSINISTPNWAGWLTPSGGSAEKVRCGNYAGGVVEKMGGEREMILPWSLALNKVLSATAERDGGGAWRGGGKAARTALMTRLVFFWSEELRFQTRGN